MKIGTRGQVSPINLIGLFILIVMLGVLMGPMYNFIDMGANATNDSVVKTLLYLIPAALVLGVLLVVFRYERPYYASP